jgi:hypothetical protein
MVNHRITIAASGALALVLVLAAPMHGTETSLHTNLLTFSGPVRLPGVTLGAGTYIFERVEPTNPDIIVVRSGDRTRKYFMGWTNRVKKPVGMAADRLVTIGEPRNGEAPPVTAWYPQDEFSGHAFIYAER